MTYIVTLFYCAECDQLYNPPRSGNRDFPRAAAHLTCEDCGNKLQSYESHDTAREEGERYERAFGDLYE